MHWHTDHQDAIDRAFDQLLADALAGYERKQPILEQRLQPFSSWNISQDETAMSFFGEGLPTFTAGEN